MIDAVLDRKKVDLKVKITVKTAVSVAVVALAVILPQIVHMTLGANGGAQWLPMYLPILLGGCLLGWKWGLCVGILSPIASFLITLAFGNPMPTAARLPYMIVELAVFASVSGMFSEKIAERAWMAFPAVWTAAVLGRCVFLASAAIFQSVSPLSVYMAWTQVQTGLIGLSLQAVLVPVLVMALSAAIARERK